MEWIRGRSINGEYGYINLKTGEFRKYLPDSKEEREVNIQKSKLRALQTHSYKEAEFDRKYGKVRNHGDELRVGTIPYPIIVLNLDGTYINTVTELIAPYEDSLKLISPEFDILTFLTGVKSIGKIFDITTRKKTYTGVPHRMKSDGTFMDESFLTTKDKFDIWTSDNPDFVTQYASNGGTKFSIFGRPRKLYQLPKVKDKNAVQNWEDMPYKITDGKIQVNPKAYTRQYSTWKTKNAGKMYETPEYANKVKTMNNPEPEVTTDMLLQNIPSKYQGIKFENLMDGPTIINGEYFDIPVNEWIYKAGADIIKAPLNTTKYDLLKDDLFNTFTKGLTILGHNISDGK